MTKKSQLASKFPAVYFYNQLDRNVIPLIEILNELPGIKTFASCGGHTHPLPHQHPRGKWFVSFRASDPAGLQILVKALLLECHHSIKLEIDGYNHDCFLSGDGASPSRAVDLIREVVGYGEVGEIQSKGVNHYGHKTF